METVMKPLSFILLVASACGALWLVLRSGAVHFRRHPMKEEFIQK